MPALLADEVQECFAPIPQSYTMIDAGKHFSTDGWQELDSRYSYDSTICTLYAGALDQAVASVEGGVADSAAQEPLGPLDAALLRPPPAAAPPLPHHSGGSPAAYAPEVITGGHVVMAAIVGAVLLLV